MVLGVVSPNGADNTSHTFQDLVVIDIGVMTHLWRTTVVVIHLTVYEVVPSLLDLHPSSVSVVKNTAFSVPQPPVSYPLGTW